MKRGLSCFLLFCLFILFLNSCDTKEVQKTSKSEIKEESKLIDGNKIYVLFSLNVHDWTLPEKSIATLNKILDIHEKYNVPIEVYLEDQVMQMYYEQSPQLLERLKTSSVVAVSYHLRPPTPYYEGGDFDIYNLETYTTEALTELLLDYEEHALDLETGEPTDQPGGYQFVKDVIGYAPFTVAGFDKQSLVGKTVAQIYKEKGAQFVVVHGRETTIGDIIVAGLYARPSTVDFRLFEYIGQDPTVFLPQNATEIKKIQPAFWGIKMHEDDFYADGLSPWRYVYYKENEKGRMVPQDPPYDITGAADAPLLTEKDRQAMWKLYEDTVAYIAAHPEDFNAINSFDLREMI